MKSLDKITAARLDEVTTRRLNDAAARTGLSPSDLIRVALIRVLDEIEKTGELRISAKKKS
jgi:predicted DNA-binding protein